MPPFQKSLTAQALLRDPSLGHSAARVGAVLALLADARGSNAGWAWPSQSTLAAWTGQSERSVRNALEALEEAGWVERRKTRMGNAYRVLEPVSEDAGGGWLDVVLGAPDARETASGSSGWPAC